MPLIAAGLFFALWNIASATLGNYGTYFLVNVTGLSSPVPPGLPCSPAAFMFAVPVVIERHQSALLWILAACVTVSGGIGLLITLHPRPAELMSSPRSADGGLHRTSA